ncbi:MAG TPA: anti-sigma-D factor RsdA [Mycobacterium sp.]|nr:anti-sigma-D factor RsdA [Mycobacterium sp.]
MTDRRPGFGGEPGVDEVARTDRFVDALAAGGPVECTDSGDRVLAALLAGWRDGLRSPPADGLLSDAAAAVALRAATVPRRHRPRGLGVVGLAAATLLALGGFGAVVLDSDPGDALYALRSTLFGEPQSVVDGRIVLTAKTEFEKVQQMIAQGDWDQAQQHLTSLGETVQTVGDTQRRQELADEWNRLNIQVQRRDPNAAPPLHGAPTSGPDVLPPGIGGQCLAACR